MKALASVYMSLNRVFIQSKVIQGAYGTWKTWKKTTFLKNSGKTWKTQGDFEKYCMTQGKLREKVSAAQFFYFM